MMNSSTTLTLTLFIAVIGKCTNFELKCPETSQRYLRAHIICNGTSTSKYYCLFDENRESFVEQCREEPDHVRPGEKYVITGRRRNVDCSSDKLQPYLFWSNASSDCVLVKSKCNEPGQVLYNNGTTKRDRACRCDYTKGFTFITKPKHPCFCVPSQEDCSCYHTACAGKTKLSPDYECVINDRDNFYSKCPPIINNRMKETPLPIHLLTGFQERQLELEDRTYIKYGTIICLCLILSAGLIHLFLLTCKLNTSLPASDLQEQFEKHVDDVQNQINDIKVIISEENPKTIKMQASPVENNIATPVENNIANTRNFVISWCNNKKFFVETRAYHEINKTLKDKHYVIIKGNPGDGKTTLACFAMKELITEQNKRPLQLFNYSEWNEFVTTDANLAIFIDNLFGEHSVSYANVTQWCQRFPTIKANISAGQQSNYIVICIRNDIYNQCHDMINDEFLNSAMVDISQGKEFELKSDEMEKIFYSYIPETNHRLSKKKISALLKDVPKLGFPQCCCLYKDFPNLREKGLDFFRNPIDFLKKELTHRFLSKDIKMAVLVCILLYGGKVSKETLYDGTTDIELKESSMTIALVNHENKNLMAFQDAIANVETSFIVHDENEDMIQFAHSSIQNAVFLVVGKYKPGDLIKNCHYTLLSLIATPKSQVKGIESVVISDKYFNILLSRIRELLVSHSSAKLKVISELKIWKDKTFFSKCLDFEDLFVEAVDEKELSLFVYFSAVGCLKWVEHLNDKNLTKRQLQLALEVACGSDKLDVVMFLLKTVQPNITCCFNAARGGFLRIINELVKAKADLCKLDETQSYWKIRSYSLTIMEEAALFNQCHLIEPLLKLCPKLTDVKSSCGISFIHTLAMAGKDQLLEKFIASNTFSKYEKSGLNSSILHFASQCNRYDTVKYIVETYPDLLLPAHYCFSGGTVLHTAAQSGNIEMFEYIHQHVLDIFGKKNITSIPLLFESFVYDANSEKQTHVDISKLLHIRDKDGETILHAAAWSRNIDMFKHVANKSIDFVGKKITNEIVSIINHAKTQSDNEDMVSFLKETYADSQPALLSVSVKCCE